MSEIFSSDFSVPVFPLLQRDLVLGSWAALPANGGKLIIAMLKSGNAGTTRSRSYRYPLIVVVSSWSRGKPMTDQELRDELMSLMFAGSETTATAMSWALYWVRLPESVAAWNWKLWWLPRSHDHFPTPLSCCLQWNLADSPSVDFPKGSERTRWATGAAVRTW